MKQIFIKRMVKALSRRSILYFSICIFVIGSTILLTKRTSVKTTNAQEMPSSDDKTATNSQQKSSLQLDLTPDPSLAPEQTKVEKQLLADHGDTLRRTSPSSIEIILKNGGVKKYESLFVEGFNFTHFEFFDFLIETHIVIVRVLGGESNNDYFLFVSANTGELQLEAGGKPEWGPNKNLLALCARSTPLDTLKGIRIVNCSSESRRCTLVLERPDLDCSELTWLSSDIITFKVPLNNYDLDPGFEYQTCKSKEVSWFCEASPDKH